MVSFQLLHSHLKDLSNNDSKGTCIKGGFEQAFATLFDQDFQSFTEVNSRVKIQSPKTRDSTKSVELTSHTQKPNRKIITGHRFSPNKSSVVHEKTNTPRSCLRWIPKGRIFNFASLSWVPTGKKFTSNTTKVDCEPLNDSNKDITNTYECNQTLNVSIVAPKPAALIGSPFSTTIDQDAPSPSNFQTSPETQTPVISIDVEEDNHDLDVVHMNNDPFFGVEESPKTPIFHDDQLHESLHEDSTSQGSSLNMKQTHTPFKSLGR
nr:hypothetical protein [Tanacetum cinerariifolium]